MSKYQSNLFKDLQEMLELAYFFTDFMKTNYDMVQKSVWDLIYVNIWHKMITAPDCDNTFFLFGCIPKITSGSGATGAMLDWAPLAITSSKR
jgi:hypothetical protein